jgi:hypothetical protein
MWLTVIQSASLLHSIDQRLKDHIRKMVWENNITSVPQMKTLLEVFMKEALFSGHHIPVVNSYCLDEELLLLFFSF